MFLFNLFSKKAANDDQWLVMRDEKINKIKEVDPRLDQSITNFLENYIGKMSISKSFSAKEEAELLLRLYQDSINTSPQIVFLSDILLPSQCNQIKSFKNFLMAQYSQAEMIALLKQYQTFEQFYRYALNCSELRINHQFVPLDCFPEDKDPEMVRVKKKEIFNQFLKNTLGEKKEIFITNYSQAIFRMTQDLILLILQEKDLVLVKSKMFINLVPNNKNITIDTLIEINYQAKNGPESTKKTSGILSTKILLENTGRMRFVRIATCSAEVAGFLLSSNNSPSHNVSGNR